MKRVMIILALCLFVVIPQTASAHASLIQATPSENSHLKKAPEKVTLTFNERLQEELYYIKVYNAQGKLVSDKKTILSKDHTKLSVGLKKLTKGTYTVSYHVISADSHPVGFSYIFDVGKESKLLEKPSAAPTGHQHGGYASLLYGLYELFFLAFAGWILIGVIKPQLKQKQKAEWYHAVKFFFVISALIVSLSDSFNAISDTSGNPWIAYLFHTQLGMVNGLRVLLVIIGIVLLQRWRVLDALWYLSYIIVEAVNGHASVFHPVPLTLTLDVVHLITASFWVGGLVYLLFHYKGQLKSYLSFFSKGAFTSLLILVVTGFMMTIIFSPHLLEVFKMGWGQLLVLKVVLVLLVFLVAAIVRKRLQTVNPHSFRTWIKIDSLLMLGILIIVGAFTHLSPFPTNQPVYWKTEKHGYTIVATLNPTNPGTTQTLQVAVKGGKRQVENVDVTLRDLDKKNLSPFHLPVKVGKSRSKNETKVKYYAAHGAYLTFPGTWEIKLTIYDQNDNYTEIKHDFTIYRVQP